MRLKRAIVAAGLLLAFGGAAVCAEPIPREKLAADQRVCVANCTSQSYALAQCTQYCGCTFAQGAQRFTLAEYTAARAAASRNQEPSKELVDRMIAISDACVAGME